MSAMFDQMAQELSSVVLRLAGPDGKVAEDRLPVIQQEAARIVHRYFVGRQGEPFDDQGQPLAPFPRIVSENQFAMIDLALARSEAIYDRYLPDDVRQQLRLRRVTT